MLLGAPRKFAALAALYVGRAAGAEVEAAGYVDGEQQTRSSRSNGARMGETTSELQASCAPGEASGPAQERLFFSGAQPAPPPTLTTPPPSRTAHPSSRAAGSDAAAAAAAASAASAAAAATACAGLRQCRRRRTVSCLFVRSLARADC